MKVFEFDPATGSRGSLICEIARPDAFSNRSGKTCVLPKMPESDWTVADKLEDRRGNAVIFDRPVCFCMGQWTAGADTTWEWVAYLPN